MIRTVKQIYGVAAGTRVLTILLALLSYSFTASYDSSAEIQVGSGFLCAFLRWDALYFLHIAEHGYIYEQETAFFPVMPLLARTMAKSSKSLVLVPFQSILGAQHTLLLAGVIISNVSFILAAGALYKLTLALLPTNKKLAAVSSLAFCLSPPSLFMSSFYTESLFAYLSFTGMRYVVKGHYLVAALIWGVTSGVRSNAIVYSGFFFYPLVWVPLVRRQQFVIGLVRSIVYSMVTMMGFGLFQYYCYLHFCSLDRPWCKQSIPLLYSFVQKEYWDVGFLAYYEIKQIPNFVLAAPIILLSVAGIYTYSQPHSTAFWSLQISNSDQNTYWSSRLAVFMYLWVFMLAYVMTSMHIQVIIRFFTSLPPLYWYVGHVWLTGFGDKSKKTSWTAAVLLSYFVLYGFIGIVLFASFLPPALAKIIEASERIDVTRTPVLTSSTLDVMASQLSPLELFFKCELFQKTGSFKFRGAANAVAMLTEEEAEKGIVAHSAGNHAGSCALAAKQRGIPAYIIVPETTPQVKKDAVRGYGATLIECEPPFEARERMAHKIEKETGATFIHPFDNVNVMAGQGTIALELLSQVKELDALIIPVGGGGLLTGCTVAARGLNPTIKVFGAEPELMNDCYKSFQEKRRVNNVENGIVSVADGLLTNLGELALSQLDSIDAVFTVSEQEIVTSMKLVWERLKLCIEPSAAVALAVALYSKPFQSVAMEQGIQRIGIIFSGGNVDIATAIGLFERFGKK